MYTKYYAKVLPAKKKSQMLYNDIRFHCKDGEKYVC